MKKLLLTLVLFGSTSVFASAAEQKASCSCEFFVGYPGSEESEQDVTVTVDVDTEGWQTATTAETDIYVAVQCLEEFQSSNSALKVLKLLSIKCEQM